MLKQLEHEAIIERAEDETTPDHYRILDVAVYGAAYQALPSSARADLHGRAADVLSEFAGRSGSGSAMAAIVATHFAQAGRPLDAADWWRTAAMDAVARSTPAEAIAFLKSAHQELKSSETQTTDAGWTKICHLLGTQLAAVHGNASPDVLAIYRRCIGSSTALSKLQNKEIFDATWGLLGCYLTRGKMANALEASRCLINLSERSESRQQAMLAHRMSGLTELLLGNLESAVFHLRSTITLYDMRSDAGLRFQYGSDQLALAHTHMAWVHALQGQQPALRSQANAALKRATALQHAHTTAHVSGVLTLAFEMMGARQEARAMDLAASMTAQRNEFPYWNAWAAIIRAAMKIEHDPLRSYEQLQFAIKIYLATGARQLLPFAFARLANANLKLLRPESAATQARVGLMYSSTTGVRIFEPELYLALGSCLHELGELNDADQAYCLAQAASRRMRTHVVDNDSMLEIDKINNTSLQKH